MPEIKVEHVVSVSSEDKQYPAENLVKGNGFKKWKCMAGEKSGVVVLQFDKDTEIAQIDIGNEGSAFVEVLVGKASCKDDEYQVILVASAFMSPQDSRNTQNCNKVRMFGADALSKAAMGQKWNRVKVVCTQPFNKTMQYGLSFIKFHSTSAPASLSLSASTSVSSSTAPATSDANKFGVFTLKTDPTSDTIRTGSLFEKSRQKTDPTPLTGAAAIRAASRTADAALVTCQSMPAKKRSHSSSSSASDDSSAADAKRPAKPQSVKLEPVKPAVKPELVKLAVKSEDKSVVKKESVKPSAAASSTSTDRIKRNTATATSSADAILKGVRFVISGIENPLRGQLRDKAQEIGAVYKPDWDKRCTHLICAFENTPKYNQVKGKGRIVTKEWIIDCHKQQKKLPWRKYRLGRAASPPPTESESSESDTETRPARGGVKQSITQQQPAAKQQQLINQNQPAKQQTTNQKEPVKEQQQSTHQQQAISVQQTSAVKATGKQTTADLFDASTDEEPEDTTEARSVKKNGVTPAASAQNNPSTAADTTQPLDDDPFNASTDDESAVNQTSSHVPSTSKAETSAGSLPDLPEFFSGKFFFLYGKFESAQRRAIVRYITAYAGTVEEYMDKKVDYVVSNESWDENFDQARSENASLLFVRPEWITACHQNQLIMSNKKYLINPS